MQAVIVNCQVSVLEFFTPCRINLFQSPVASDLFMIYVRSMNSFFIQTSGIV